MLNLDAALRKLSVHELKLRWDEYKQLPCHAREALQSYALLSAIVVGAIILIASGALSHRPHFGLSDGDRLGMIFLTDAANRN